MIFLSFYHFSINIFILLLHMLSKTSKYGLKATTHMVSHHEAGKLFKVEELSTELQIPKHFLAKVMLDLTKKGILSSVKGPRGGFYFSDIQLEFTPADVIFALENDDFLRTCIMEIRPCDLQKTCPFHNKYSVIKQEIISGLQCNTFRDLISTS
ncbi:MAG: Rrf2 family transcriptional regulator [Saprospiraceae bacterium]|nr:Rrf2 family transcriptional regulator [Saprospiraceae bacterium]MBK9377701.1 Rrf2 family transcriptional regulator [Saprospiraceae bacterium]